MVCYEKGRIYGIYDTDGVCVYVGSTCQPIAKRKAEHKVRSKQIPDRIIYRHIEEKGGWDCFDFRLITEVSCENKEQLLREEGRYIRELNPVGNKRVAGRTQKEWKYDNPEKARACVAKWFAENVEYRRQYMREYRQRKKAEKQISSTNSDSESCLL